MYEHTAAADPVSIDLRRARKTIQERVVVLEAARVALADVMSSAEILAQYSESSDPLHHLGLAFIGADRTLREFLRATGEVQDAQGKAAGPTEEAPR